MPEEKALRSKQLVENIQRVGLAAIEEAEAFADMIQANGWTGKDLAHNLGISQSRVAKALGLLKLPTELRIAVESGTISKSIGYELSMFDAEEALDLAAMATDREWTVDQLKAYVREKAEAAEVASRPPEAVAPILAETPTKTVAQLRAETDQAVAEVRARTEARATDPDPPPKPPRPETLKSAIDEPKAPSAPSSIPGEYYSHALGRYRRQFKTTTDDGAEINVTVDAGEEAGAAAVEALALACNQLRAVYGLPKEWQET